MSFRPSQAKGPSVTAGGSGGSRYWLDPVIEIYNNTFNLPVGPSTGDRYIALVTAHGWTANQVYEWSGSAWTETTVENGMAVYVESPEIYYGYLLTCGWFPIALILYGTGEPPDPTHYPTPVLYVQYDPGT